MVKTCFRESFGQFFFFIFSVCELRSYSVIRRYNAYTLE